jgi:hypothetical protein
MAMGKRISKLVKKLRHKKPPRPLATVVVSTVRRPMRPDYVAPTKLLDTLSWWS